MYRVKIKFPGKLIRWQNNLVRTPVKLVLKSEAELKLIKATLKKNAIGTQYYTIEEISKEQQQ